MYTRAIDNFANEVLTSNRYTNMDEIKINTPIKVRRMSSGKKSVGEKPKYMTGVTTSTIVRNHQGCFIEAKCSGVNYFCEYVKGEWRAKNIAKQSSKGKW